MSLTTPEALRLRSTLNQWMTLFNAHDIDGLMELYDPDATYAPHSSARKSTLSAIRESFIADFVISPVATFTAGILTLTKFTQRKQA